MRTRFQLSFILIAFLGFSGWSALPARAGNDLSGLFAPSKQYQHILVKRVISADTIVLGNGERVHLIGLRAPVPPERPRDVKRDKFGFIIEQPVSPATTVAQRSLAFAQRLLEGKHVRLEFDEQRRGGNDFLTQAYVFLPDGTFANAAILRQGYANLSIEPPNTKYAGRLRKAYREAWKEKRGLQGE